MTVRMPLRMFAGFLVAVVVAGCGEPAAKQRRGTRDRGGDESTTAKSGDGKKDAGAAAGTSGWATIKGRILWGSDQLPAPVTLMVTKDQDHCLEGNKPLLDNSLVIDPKTKGIQDVIVYLRGKPKAIHDSYPKDKKAVAEQDAKKFEELNKIKLDLKAISKAVEEKKIKVGDIKANVLIDQPRCLYIPHAIAAREGQTTVLLNPAPPPVSHNVKVSSVKNNSNSNMPAQSVSLLNWAAESTELGIECSIHPWMKGSAMVFDHPYFAVTGADGSFELKNVPAGEVTLVIRRSPQYINPETGKGGASITGGKFTLKPDEVKDLGEIKYVPGS